MKIISFLNAIKQIIKNRYFLENSFMDEYILSNEVKKKTKEINTQKK